MFCTCCDLVHEDPEGGGVGVEAKLTLLTVSEACCSMFLIQLRMLLKEASSVTSYTNRMPMAPR